jgi:hypothetical protein
MPIFFSPSDGMRRSSKMVGGYCWRRSCGHELADDRADRFSDSLDGCELASGDERLHLLLEFLDGSGRLLERADAEGVRFRELEVLGNLVERAGDGRLIHRSRLS